MVAERAELRAEYGTPLTESDSGGIPASIREKAPKPPHPPTPPIGGVDEKLNPRSHISPLCMVKKKGYKKATRVYSSETEYPYWNTPKRAELWSVRRSILG